MKSRTSLFTIALALLSTTACVGAPDGSSPAPGNASEAEPGGTLGESPEGVPVSPTETMERVVTTTGGSGGTAGETSGGSGGASAGAGGGGGEQPPTGGAGTGGSDDDLSDILFPPYPDLDQPALPELVRAKKLLGLLEKTLGTDGDRVVLEVGGEMDVPVAPGVAVGGEVKIAFTVTLNEDEAGNQTFLLEGGADTAAAANLSGGILSASGGATRAVGVRWRFDTHAEVVGAIQRMVILRVIGPRLEIAATALHDRVNGLDNALSHLRQRRREILDWLFGWFELDTQLLEEIRRKQDELNLVHRGLDRLNQLTGWVVDARGFLMDHFAGAKAELGKEVKVELDLAAFETGGDTAAVLGFQAEGSVERSVTVELETLDNRAGVSAGITLEFQKAGSAAGGGLGGTPFVGIAVGFERKLEISAKGTLTRDGVRLDDAGPNAVLSLDRSYHGTLGAGIAGRYGLGRGSAVGVSLGALASLGAQAIESLVAGNPEQAAQTLSTLPLEFEGQARIERGLMIGIGGELGDEYLGAKVYAEAVWADAGEKIALTRTPTLSTLMELTSISAEDAIPETDLALLDAVGEQVVTFRNAF